MSATKTPAEREFVVRKITLSAIFLALAVVMRVFSSISIPLLGESGLKVGFAGIFTTFPSLLFGPLYGGAVQGLCDLFGSLIAPTGAYNPLFTLTAFIGGFLKGCVWLAVKKTDGKTLRRILAVLLILILALGAYSAFAINRDALDPAALFDEEDALVVDISGYSLPSRLVIARAAATSNSAANLPKYINYFTAGIIGFAALGLLIMAADALVQRYGKRGDDGFCIALTVCFAGLVQTTLNTVILREMIFASWQSVPFLLLWAPRAVEEVAVGIVQALIIALLYGIYLRQIKPKSFLKDM